MKLAIPVQDPGGSIPIPGAVCINLDTGEPIPKGKSLYPNPGSRAYRVPRAEGGFYFVYEGELA